MCTVKGLVKKSLVDFGKFTLASFAGVAADSIVGKFTNDTRTRAAASLGGAVGATFVMNVVEDKVLAAKAAKAVEAFDDEFDLPDDWETAESSAEENVEE